MKKLISAAVVALSFAGTVVADEIYINVGSDYGGNANTVAGDTSTGWKSSLKLTFDSTSIVTDLDGSGTITAGDSILSSGGLAVGGAGDNQVTKLITAEVLGAGPSDNGYGSSWMLSFRFDDLVGTWNGTDFIYTSGTIDWLLFDANSGALSNEIHLFTTNITSHSSAVGNQVYSGTVDNFGTGNTFGADGIDGTADDVDAGDVLNIKYGGTSYSFDDYVALISEDIYFRIDQNTDQPIVTGGCSGCSAEGFNEIYIGGSHDGSLEFSVPEPGSIAILGLGLLGFAGASRRKS